MRHRWSQPDRPDVHNTIRTCLYCGCLKITRHESRVWVEYWDGDAGPWSHAPKCPGPIETEKEPTTTKAAG